ncbi:hypothetical protein [Glaciecola sp. KUL10]|uniref:hypothetical protein n=1 Tax=Glaciecola sp. (strain KUL10) TaxID=2161813 RepID=UPI000D787920|nr:hypothetical protein [Glaciecola sp. KUL10]
MTTTQTFVAYFKQNLICLPLLIPILFSDADTFTVFSFAVVICYLFWALDRIKKLETLISSSIEKLDK